MISKNIDNQIKKLEREVIRDANLLTIFRQQKASLIDRIGAETYQAQESLIVKRIRLAQSEIRALVFMPPPEKTPRMPSFIELIDENGTVYKKREVVVKSFAV